MEFGYFTLSDNHYENNSRDANQFIVRHHRRSALRRPARHAFGLDRRASFQFARRALLARAGAGLHRGAHQAHPPCARRQRDAAAPSDPRRRAMGDARPALSNGRVDFAAGRGYDSREYLPFKVDFADNQSIFEEGMEVVQKLWSAEGRISHHGKHYQFDDVRITPKPMQKPLPAYIGSFSKPSIELAARLGYGLIVAPFAAAMSYGGLKQVADLYNETCVKHGKKPGRLMCSYFAISSTTPAQEDAAARAPDPLLQGMRDPGVPGRSEDRAAELPLFHRHGGAAAQGEAGGPDRELGAARQRRAHHRHAEEGRGRGLLRGDPLLQRRHEAAPAGQGGNGPLHARGRAALPGKHKERRAA